MLTRLCLFPPNAALALAPARVRLLRQRFDGLGGFDEASPIAIARAISFRELPDRTTEFFHNALFFGTDEGREVIAETARVRRDLASWLLLTPTDVAFDVVRAVERGDEVAKAVAERARKNAQPGVGGRTECELSAKTHEPPTRPHTIIDVGRLIHGERFVDGWIIACRDGAIRAIVIHERSRNPSLVRNGPAAAGEAKPAREWVVPSQAKKSLVADAIRWDSARGRVGLALGRASTLPAWRIELGRHCAGDEAYFAP